MVSQYNISEGTDVYGSDGEKVGAVVAVQSNYVVVEKGFFFPTDYYIPTSAIANAEEGRVYLNVTKDAALNQGWDTEPTGGYATDMGATTTTGTVVETDTVATGSAYVDPAPTMATSADVTRTDAGMGVAAAMPATAAVETTRVDANETISVPIHEEELTATTRQREIGEVQIQKDVVSEQRTIEVPVTEERVRVQRRAVDRSVTADDTTAFQEGTIEVPIRGEEVELQKTVRVAEEVEIGKEAVQRTEQVSGTVRREEVNVSENKVDTARTVETAPTTAATTTRTTTTTQGGGVVDQATEGGGLLDQAADAVRNTGRSR